MLAFASAASMTEVTYELITFVGQVLLTLDLKQRSSVRKSHQY